MENCLDKEAVKLGLMTQERTWVWENDLKFIDAMTYIMQDKNRLEKQYFLKFQCFTFISYYSVHLQFIYSSPLNTLFLFSDFVAIFNSQSRSSWHSQLKSPCNLKIIVIIVSKWS